MIFLIDAIPFSQKSLTTSINFAYFNPHECGLFLRYTQNAAQPQLAFESAFSGVHPCSLLLHRPLIVTPGNFSRRGGGARDNRDLGLPKFPYAFPCKSRCVELSGILRRLKLSSSDVGGTSPADVVR